MHRKPESDLFPGDSELERTLRSLRKVSREEKATRAYERIDQTVEQETSAKKPLIKDTMEDFLEACYPSSILSSQTTCCRG